MPKSKYENIRDENIKQKGKVALKKGANAYLTLLYLWKEAFPRSHPKLCDVNERLDGLPSREPLLSDNEHVTQF